MIYKKNMTGLEIKMKEILKMYSGDLWKNFMNKILH